MDGNEVPRSSIVESDTYLKLYVCIDRQSDGSLESDCKEEDRRVLNETKHVFGRADESISDGHGENVKAEHDNVSEASGISRDRWMMQSMIFDRGRKQACHKCGTYGHKGVNCPENKTSESNTQFRRGTCWFCEKQGHLIFDCKELQQMRAERTKKEVANVAFEDSDNESTDELAF
jgi:hypothetical protein